LTLAACSLALDGVDFDTERNDAGEPVLVVNVDRDRLQRQLRSGKRMLREKLVARLAGDGGDGYGLKLDPAWKDAPADRSLVVLVHGYTVTDRSMTALASFLKEQGHATGVFSYPNDGPLEESAALLARELKELREEQPKRPVAIVAHSMGGLVTRAAIEDPELDPRNVRQLIMIATPNHGSELARIPVSLDVWEHFLHPGHGGFENYFTDTVSDGLDEARSDLKPDSLFLKRLNERPRNPKVRYTLILGSGGPFEDGQMASLRESWDRCCERSRTMALFGPRVEPLLQGAELCKGRGDGAVSVESGKLDGVSDVVVLPFRHNVLVRGLDSETGADVLKVLNDRLKPAVAEQ
jgi:pimeloyl-ACP methyl ester carboxylesterase